MGKMFSRGYKAVRQEKDRQDKQKEARQNSIWRFRLPEDGDEADITFLTSEPINFHEHNVKTKKNGKEHFDTVFCPQDSKCELCADGDRPSYKSAYLVIDHREFDFKDKDGKKKKRSDVVRLFVFGTKVTSQLDRINEKYGLQDDDGGYMICTAVRLGSGQQTNYTIERGEYNYLSEKEIENILPENLREKYDGTEDSLYQIVEDAIVGVASNNSGDEDDDDEDTSRQMRGRLVSTDDDDDEDVRPSKPRGVVSGKVSKLGAPRLAQNPLKSKSSAVKPSKLGSALKEDN